MAYHPYHFVGEVLLHPVYFLRKSALHKYYFNIGEEFIVFCIKSYFNVHTRKNTDFILGIGFLLLIT